MVRVQLANVAHSAGKLEHMEPLTLVNDTIRRLIQKSQKGNQKRPFVAQQEDQHSFGRVHVQFRLPVFPAQIEGVQKDGIETVHVREPDVEMVEFVAQFRQRVALEASQTQQPLIQR